MLVYRPDGVAEDKDPVDARECVKHCGYSTTPPEVVAAPVESPVVEAAVAAEEAPVADQFEDMDDAALRAYLAEHGKSAHHKAGIEKLRVLCREVAADLV